MHRVLLMLGTMSVAACSSHGATAPTPPLAIRVSGRAASQSSVSPTTRASGGPFRVPNTPRACGMRSSSPGGWPTAPPQNRDRKFG
jgi:hypothetical protein